MAFDLGLSFNNDGNAVVSDGTNGPTSLAGSYNSAAATNPSGSPTSSGSNSYLGQFAQIASIGLTAFQGYNAAEAQKAQAQVNRKAAKLHGGDLSTGLLSGGTSSMLIIGGAILLIVVLVLKLGKH